MQPAVACLAHTRRRGYHLEGIVLGRWEAVEEMMQHGDVDVVVVADPAHLPADRTPRVEVAGEMLTSPADMDRHVPPRLRRPHTR